LPVPAGKKMKRKKGGKKEKRTLFQEAEGTRGQEPVHLPTIVSMQD